MCCVLLFLCSVGFPAHERLGRVSWEKKKKKEEEITQEESADPEFSLLSSPPDSLSLYSYIYI
jgi:hypothetical protein